MVIDQNYFPGWVRKSFTFTIDDGNIQLDTKFINIVKPYGIIGTFNLSSPRLESYTPEFYRDLYRGYGISNHCKYHPYVLSEDKMRISYAASWGGVFADANLEKYKEELSKFKSISIREPQFIKETSDLAGKDVVDVCDPSLLLTKEDYIALEKKKHKPKKYIVVFDAW